MSTGFTLEQLKRGEKFTVLDYMNCEFDIDDYINYLSPLGLIALSQIIDYVKDPSKQPDIELSNEIASLNVEPITSHFIAQAEKILEQDEIKKKIKEFVKRRLKISRPGDGNNYVIGEMKKKYNGSSFLTASTTDNGSIVSEKNGIKNATPYTYLKERLNPDKLNPDNIRLSFMKNGKKYTISDNCVRVNRKTPTISVKPTITKKSKKASTKAKGKIVSKKTDEEMICVCLYCGKTVTKHIPTSSHQVGVKPAFLNHQFNETYNMNVVMCCSKCNGYEATIGKDKSEKGRLLEVYNSLGSSEFKQQSPDDNEIHLNSHELKLLFTRLLSTIDMVNPYSSVGQTSIDYVNRLGLHGFRSGVWNIDKIIVNNLIEQNKDTDKLEQVYKEFKEIIKDQQKEIENYQQDKNQQQQLEDNRVLTKELENQKENVTVLMNMFEQKIKELKKVSIQAAASSAYVELLKSEQLQSLQWTQAMDTIRQAIEKFKDIGLSEDEVLELVKRDVSKSQEQGKGKNRKTICFTDKILKKLTKKCSTKKIVKQLKPKCRTKRNIDKIKLICNKK